MPTVQDSDFIQNGFVVTMGDDGQVYKAEKIFPRSLATDETTAQLLAWLDENIPEGQQWAKRDINVSQGQTIFTCPCWQAVARNGFMVSAGYTWYDLFYYPNPTQATLDLLHQGASTETIS
jgi:hypothetical protein